MSELDKTIEQLEAEILEEMASANEPKKSATSPDKMQSVPGESDDLGEKPEDGNKSVKKAAPPKTKTISASTEFNDKDLEELEEKKKMSMKEMEDDEEDDDEEEEMDEMKMMKAGKKHDMKKEEDDEEEDDEDMEEMYHSSKKMKKEEEDEEEDDEEVNEVAIQMGMNEKKPVVAVGVKGMDSKAFKKKFKNYAAYEKWADSDAADDFEIRKVMNEMDETLEDRLSQIDVSEDVSALTEGHDLTEEFKEKASVIFEAAVKSKLREEIQRLEEEKQAEIEEYVDGYKDELVEKVDKYLNYVVEQWTNDNQLAVERGLKGEIAEDFIAGLRTLFEEHYIDVPNEKYDVLESQAQQIEDLENKLNEQIQNSVDLKNEVSKYIRESIFVEVSEDLSDTEKEKFESLVTETEYIDEESFRFKLTALKESYFPKTKTISESVDTQDTSVENVEVSGTMAKYLQAITTTKNKF